MPGFATYLLAIYTAAANAVRTGQSILIEDVGETLDPGLEPLLPKQIVRQGGRAMLKLGDSLVEYDRNFKLFISTTCVRSDNSATVFSKDNNLFTMYQNMIKPFWL